VEGSGPSFIVRVTSAGAGQLSGTVERVRTGEKHQFRGLKGLRALIAGMVVEATKQPDERPSTP